MHTFDFDDVNEAFHELVERVHTSRIEMDHYESRNGPAMRFPEPVIIAYRNPRKRVLFNLARDCNPFFHLYEAMWMLAGQHDVESVAYYASNIKNYSDDGVILNGAYGHRWRRRANLDQLSILVKHLTDDPNSRRAVLQMWTIKSDLLKIDHQFDTKMVDGSRTGFSKDVCCNTNIYFSMRRSLEPHPGAYAKDGVIVVPITQRLDMTVCNRSNDLVWGLLGANYVHFSFLHEYMANCLGVNIGTYYHFSNDLHIYKNNWEPEEWLAEPLAIYPPFLAGMPLVDTLSRQEDFDRECLQLVKSHGAMTSSEPFLHNIVRPMCNAFKMHKQRNYKEALEWMSQVKSDDWQRAGTAWITKRWRKYEE